MQRMAGGKASIVIRAIPCPLNITIRPMYRIVLHATVPMEPAIRIATPAGASTQWETIASCAIRITMDLIRLSNCYGWPENDFSPTNKAPVMTGLTRGSQAIDFTLKDPSGQAHNLYELLETRPVLLVFGAFT